MAYKISGAATHDGRAHVIKNGVYIGYKDITAGAYDLVFDADNNAGVMTVAEKSDGETVGYGGMTAVPTVDSVNITLPSSGASIKQIIRASGVMNGVNGLYHSFGGTIDPTKSMLISAGSFYNYTAGLAGVIDRGMVAMRINSATQIRAERGDNTAFDVFFSYSIIEFESGVASVQRNIFNQSSMSPSYTDITISSVDTSKCVISMTQAADYNYQTHAGYLELVNSTTLRVHHNTVLTSGLQFGWEVVEFE